MNKVSTINMYFYTLVYFTFLLVVKQPVLTYCFLLTMCDGNSAKM